MNISHAVSPRLNLYGACRTPPKQEVHRTAVWPWVHGDAGDLMCLMNMKRHLPYVSTDIVIQLYLSCWLTLSTGKLSWPLLTKIRSGLQCYKNSKVTLKFTLSRLGLL